MLVGCGARLKLPVAICLYVSLPHPRPRKRQFGLVDLAQWLRVLSCQERELIRIEDCEPIIRLEIVVRASQEPPARTSLTIKTAMIWPSDTSGVPSPSLDIDNALLTICSCSSFDLIFLTTPAIPRSNMSEVSETRCGRGFAGFCQCVRRPPFRHFINCPQSRSGRGFPTFLTDQVGYGGRVA